MSVKTTSNLLIIGAVAIALLAGSVLLADYANILSVRSGSQAKSCQAGGGTPCCGAKVSTNESAQAVFAQQAGAGFDAEACPLGRTEPCCAGDVKESLCGKTCPLDGTKPCCAEEGVKGCCPKPCCPEPCCPKPCCPGETPPECCPKTSSATE